MLDIRGLKVFYGIHEAVCGVDMEINEGEITAVIGSNGAGKTTIINAISGMVPRQGEIRYSGAPLPAQANRVVRQGVVQVPEGRKIFAGLTVEENLTAGAYTVKNRKEIERLLQEQYEMFPRLKERRRQDAGTLSGGEQQMLAICRGLMAKPKVLMLDEPSLGLAPVVVNEVFHNIQRICQEGITVILVEQNAKKSLSICDRAYVIETGRVVISGTGGEMLENPEVASAYLGTARDQ
ncbi:ABC transporter ATP-binding protein [Colidextribacter sp. OB.20]|uniref:ABC transporter ATP-binding protein n=1 Tax=Colidextribacter sp. OB.20 TaxID=2304568 RepID=UPI00325FC167